MFKKNQDERLDLTIYQVYAKLADTLETSNEFDILTTQLSKLYKLKESNSQKRVSPDTMLMAGANLLGILMIVGHERANVVTSKAMSFVTRLH